MKIIPLGGLGEIGKNMMVVEYNNQILIIDAGIAFPSEINTNPGFGIADTKYLSDKKDMIQGVLITHGHDDHIGGLPYFLNQFQVPVYSTPLTKTFIMSCKFNKTYLMGQELQRVKVKQKYKQ